MSSGREGVENLNTKPTTQWKNFKPSRYQYPSLWMNQTIPGVQGEWGGDHLVGSLPNYPYNGDINGFKIVYLYIKSTTCSKNKRPDSDPIHSSMNQGHSQQDPQDFFNAEQVSDRLHSGCILGAEHVTHSWVLYCNCKRLFEIHLSLLVLPENCALIHSSQNKYPGLNGV